VIADLKPYAEYKGSGLPWLGLCVKNAKISSVRRAIEKEAEGLLYGLLMRRSKT
jgi:hypothetical protein